MSELMEKEKRAISYLQNFQPENEPYYLCYSGGKDSDCVRVLAELAGVSFDLEHNLTTVDAPETVRYVKKVGAHINKPEMTMWELIEDRTFPPMRQMRYCCTVLKERGGQFRKKLTGVRWAESFNRRNNAGLVKLTNKPVKMAKEATKRDLDFKVLGNRRGIILNTDDSETRRFVEHCYRTVTTLINPIVDWTTDEVWEFLHAQGCEGNPLYKTGENRIGCIGCPMQGAKGMIEDFMKYPTYKRAYIRAFDKAIAKRKERGLEVPERWRDGKTMMDWWLQEDYEQVGLEDFYDTTDYLYQY